MASGRFRLSMSLVILSLLFACEVTSASPFSIEFVDGWVTETGCYSNVKVDGLGHPHIVYVDNSPSSPLRHAWKDQDGWHTEVIDPEPGLSCNQLAIDKAGGIHFAYVNRNTYVVKYAVRRGARIDIVALDTMADDYDEAVIALDANGGPHIAYQKANNSVWYARGSPTGWQLEEVATDANAATVLGRFLSIAVSPDGAPQVVYDHLPAGSTQSTLRLARRGANWRSEVVATATGSLGVNSLAIDHLGDPHVAYWSPDNATVGINYAQKLGGVWVNERVDAQGEQYVFIALDEREVPHLIYNRTASGGAVPLIYLRRGATGWNLATAEQVDVSSSPAEFGVTVAADGAIHISYFDLKAGRGDLKYATTSVCVRAPIGGERWSWGAAGSVKWDGAGSVDIELSVDGGGVFTRVASSVVGGSYELKVPSINTGRALIRVRSREGPSVSTSEAPFYIAQDLSNPWWTERVDSAGVRGRFPSIALDTGGQPRMAYHDQTAGRLRYAQRSGTGWVSEIADGSTDVGQFASLALNSNGEPRIAYHDVGKADLRFVGRIGGAWGAPEVVDSVGYVGLNTSLVLSREGAPRIAYLDVTNSRLKFARKDNGGWNLSVVDADGPVGGGCSLALDRSDRPHISYFDFGAARLKYATFADGAWLSEVIDSRADVGVSTSIAVSRSGLPSISYYDGLNHDLCLASADRLGGWSIEVVDSMGDVGSVSSLQLDARGEPHIAYRDATLGVVKYARREGGRWVREIVTPSIGLGGELGLALDDQGLARVAYYDATTSDLAYASRAVEFTALPRAGSWPVGARRSIVWGGTGRVAVELSGDGGATYSPLADGLTQGHFDFTVPNMVSGACKVRLLREVPRSVGVSDTLFGITPGVVLLSMATEAIPEGNGWAVRWRTDPGPPDLLGYRLERAQQGEVWRTIYESAGATLYDDHQGAPDARYRLFAITPTKQEVLVGESSHMLGGPLLVGPSPYRGGRLIISYVLPKQGRVEVGLYDISGRRVAILAEGPEVAGTHSVAWKGTTDTGRTVPSGIYFVKLKSDNDVAVRRIAVCR